MRPYPDDALDRCLVVDEGLSEGLTAEKRSRCLVMPRWLPCRLSTPETWTKSVFFGPVMEACGKCIVSSLTDFSSVDREPSNGDGVRRRYRMGIFRGGRGAMSGNRPEARGSAISRP